jgi:hypothetical protein
MAISVLQVKEQPIQRSKSNCVDSEVAYAPLKALTTANLVATSWSSQSLSGHSGVSRDGANPKLLVIWGCAGDAVGC